MVGYFAFHISVRRVVVLPALASALLSVAATGADTVRTTYRLGGRIVAVQTKVGAAAGAFYFTYTDHLGNISAMSMAAGVYVADSGLVRPLRRVLSIRRSTHRT